MTLIKYNKLPSFIESLDDIPELFLIYGESFLSRQAFETVTSFLLGNEEFALEILEGGSVSMGELIERIKTFSFFVSKKVIGVKNVSFSSRKQGGGETSFSGTDIDRLLDLIEKGMPAYLVFTANSCDKRKKIFKAIEKKGLVVDCSVPLGLRQADLEEQKRILCDMAGGMLSKSGKTINKNAFNALTDLTEFNLEIFSSNLEKLISYSGNKKQICLKDVKAVIRREKKDPIFNLTNALMIKDPAQSLFFLDSLLKEGLHLLQILKAFENQIRKLILVKCFVNKENLNLKSMNFNSFRKNILPGIVDHDEDLKEKIHKREELLSLKPRDRKSEKNDLLLAPNPNNAYPVFQVFQKSENFSLNHLSRAIIFLGDLDYGLKSSAFEAKTAIEDFIIKFCGEKDFADSQL